MSRAKSKPRHEKPATPVAPSPPSSRTSLLVAALLAVAALAFLGYRAYQAVARPRQSERLHLTAEVALTPPPPLPGDDRAALRDRLAQVAALHQRAQASPNDPNAHREVAQLAMRAGDFLTAREEFRASLKMDSQAAPAVYDNLGQCEAQLGLHKAALNTYQALLRQTPDSVDGYIGFSRAQFRLGEKVESLKTLDRATRVAQTVPDKLHLAHEFEKRGDLARALTEIQAVRKTAPDDPLATLLEGRLLFQHLRLAEARQLLEKMVAAHPEDTRARTLLADVVDNPMTPGRDRALSEELFLEAAQQSPNDTAPYAKLGTMYLEQRRFRQAAYVMTRLLEIAPDTAAARMQLAKAYEGLGDARMNKEQQEIAQRLLTRDRKEASLTGRVERQPESLPARLDLARHYSGAGQFAKALAQLQAAYCLSSGSAEIGRELSGFYRQIGAPPPTLPTLTE